MLCEWDWLMRSIDKLTLFFRLVRRFMPWVRAGIARVRRLCSFSDFWKKLANQGLVIILSPKDARRILNGTQSCDVLGAEEIQNLFKSIGNQCDIIADDREFDNEKFRQNLRRNLQSENKLIRNYNPVVHDILRIIASIRGLAEADHSQNLLVAGGPRYHQVACSLLQREELVYEFEWGDGNTSIIHRHDSTFKYQVQTEQSNGTEIVTQDYGLITVMKNPYDRKKKAILASGCRGWGTYSALKLLGDTENLKLLRKIGPYFQVLLTCEVELDLPLDPSLLMDTKVELYR